MGVPVRSMATAELLSPPFGEQGVAKKEQGTACCNGAHISPVQFKASSDFSGFSSWVTLPRPRPRACRRLRHALRAGAHAIAFRLHRLILYTILFSAAAVAASC